MRGPVNIERRTGPGRRDRDRQGATLRLREAQHQHDEGFKRGMVELAAYEVIGVAVGLAIYVVTHLAQVLHP